MNGALILLANSGGGSSTPVDLIQVSRIRGAMWTARAALPYGPRPGAVDNCICIDYYEHFSADDRRKIQQAYIMDRGYWTAPMGPMCDPGYHGQLPASDFRSDPTPFLDAVDELQTCMRAVHGPQASVVNFVRPDRGCFGLDWTIDDLDRELGSIFASSRCQDLFQSVCLGWEPGPKYYYDNAWWVEMCQWLERTFPNALRLIHMVADCDAPVGGDDDKKGISNGQGWANVARHIHGYLAQYGGYVGDGTSGPTVAEFMPDFQAALNDMQDRFDTGRAGWPTFSAWGDGKPVRVYAGEYAAFRAYWGNDPEPHSIQLGNGAMETKCYGYLDGGSADVPTR
jgi:hypothetical protein